MPDLMDVVGSTRSASTCRTGSVLTQLLIAGVVFAGLVGGCLVFSQHRDDVIDDDAFTPVNYQSAVPDLIRLCQTNPTLLQHTGEAIDFAGIPSLARLNPKSVTITPDFAGVNWGGSLHHAGWHLYRDTEAHHDPNVSTWTFRLYGDGGRPVPD